MHKILLQALLVAALGVSACGDDKDNGGKASERTPESVVPKGTCDNVKPVRTIFIGDNFFEPDEIDINVGDVVRWLNTGKESHTVTSGERDHKNAGALFDVRIPPGEEFCFKFDVTAEESDNFDDVDYFCRDHKSMNSEVEFKDVDRRR